MVVVLVPLVVPLVPLVRFSLIEMGAGLEVEAAPLVAVALGVMVVASPSVQPFNTGLLLLFPSSRLLMAALLSRSSSSRASWASFFFLHPLV